MQKKSWCNTKEIAAVITHVAFWQVGQKHGLLQSCKEVWEAGEGDLPYKKKDEMRAHAKRDGIFQSVHQMMGLHSIFLAEVFLAPISTSQVGIFSMSHSNQSMQK